MKKEIVVAVSGYFDPIHVGHLEYLQLASQLGDKLIVIINNNHQAEIKKGEFFMHENDRMEIVAALKCVDEVFLSIDKDASVCKSLEAIKPDIFANGGDRSLEEIPETSIMKKYNIKMVDGLGDKIRSSSDLTGIGK
jgi:cytidyltransferase-like protein